jgi:gluconolactonase
VIKFEDGGMDGMRCDAAGNLYVTRWGKGEVVVVTPAGQVLRTVKTQGLKTSNIAFGGKDGKTCYVTLQDTGRLETFRAEKPGREFMMMKRFLLTSTKKG